MVGADGGGSAVRAAVRARRWLPTAVAQTVQRVAQRSVTRKAQQHKQVLEGINPFTLARFGFVQRSVAHLIGVGVRPERAQTPPTNLPQR